jgi:adenylate cyclase
MADILSINAHKQRAAIVFGICAVVMAVFVLLHWRGFVPLTEAENYVQDWFARRGRKTPIDPRLVLIGIDKASYAQDILESEAQADPVLAALRANFPWSRTVWAALIEKLGNAGARAIAIDLVFANPGEGDDSLRQALEKFKDRVIIGCNFNLDQTDRGTNWSLTVPYAGILPPANSLPVALDERVGLINAWPDEDGVLRHASFRIRNEQLNYVVSAGPDAVIETLGARALRKLGQPQKIPGSSPLRFRYTAPPGLGFTPLPIGDLFSAKAWKDNYNNGEWFRDKLILIGPTVNILHDFHRTPFPSDMAGPEIHLNIINAALHNEFLREPPRIAEFGLIGLAGIIAALLGILVSSPLRRIGAGLLLNGGYLIGAQMLFDHGNVVVLTVGPLLALDLSGLAVLAYDFIIEKLERAKLRHTMSLYFSPRVLEAVLADPGSMNPRRAEVTLLLTDLRNSTLLAERLGPKGMFELLNRVFEAQTNAIMSEEGNLEHFLGDQFLSYWGAPQPQTDGPDRAERAALKLIVAMEQLRASLTPDVQELFGYGVGLHSGGVLVGNKGSARRLDYGLVGDAVNEAARLESLTKYYGVRLLISRETFAQLVQEGTRRLVDRVIVKGKSTPVELFERENLCTPKNYPELCRRYKAAYDEYFFGHFAAALAEFNKLVTEFGDEPSRTLAGRCTDLAARPPANWDGIWKMEGK